jgi:hypothetical protein
VKGNLETQLQALRAGAIGFTRFAYLTRADFGRMAAYLLRRWKTPTWFVEEDVVQELLFAASEHARTWDPARGVPLARYVAWNAARVAKRWMHKARGVSINGSPDRKVSRFELPFSALGDVDEEGDDFIARIADGTASAEDILAARTETVAVAQTLLDACWTPRERRAVEAVKQTGDHERAGRHLYDNVEHRIELRLGSEEKAEAFVTRTVAEVWRRSEPPAFDLDESYFGVAQVAEAG